MRVALHTRLKPGKEEQYERAYREVPPEPLAAIKAAGVAKGLPVAGNSPATADPSTFHNEFLLPPGR
jgi:hypothetical protein